MRSLRPKQLAAVTAIALGMLTAIVPFAPAEMIGNLSAACEIASQPKSDSQRVADAGQLRCLNANNDQWKELEELETAKHRLTSLPGFGPHLQELIEFSQVGFCWDRLSVQCQGYFDPELNVIAVTSGLSLAEKTIILAHELRHVDQYRRGYRLSLAHHVREHVRQTYALEADAQAFVTLVAWTAGSEGDHELWDALIGSERYADIPLAFKRAMLSGLREEDALLTAFRTWYGSKWRREQYWISAASNYYDLLDQLHAIQRYARFPDTHFDGLCQLPDGKSYSCHETEEIKQVVTGR